MRKSKLDNKLDEEKAKPAPRPLAIPYVPWVLCLTAPEDHPDWQGQEWVRLDSFENAKCTDRLYVGDYVHKIAMELEKQYGGQWSGVVRPSGQLPRSQPALFGEKARIWAESHILNGPDSPGRRYLMAKHKDLIPVIKNIEPSPAPSPSPIKADEAFWAQPVESDDPADDWQAG